MKAARRKPGGRDGSARVRQHTSMGSVGDRRRSVSPPALREGQVRCPVCRAATRPTPSGRLRRHVDCYGLDCYNTTPARAGS